jgi:hypothetical protein
MKQPHLAQSQAPDLQTTSCCIVDGGPADAGASIIAIADPLSPQ